MFLIVIVQNEIHHQIIFLNSLNSVHKEISKRLILVKIPSTGNDLGLKIKS